MLPDNLFKPLEPKGVYPVFENCENRITYVMRSSNIPTPGEAIRHAAGRIVKRDRALSPAFLTRIILDSFRGIRLRFRGAFLDRQGTLLATFPHFGTIHYLEGFDISVNELLNEAGVPLQDGQFLLIADRGIKLDGSYGTGTIGAVYLNDHTYTCYRNGAFARPFNEFRHHRPVGFRSIGPHMKIDDEIESHAYFWNFSTDTRYDETARPRARLYRNKTEYLESHIGPIPPFGAADVSMTELFGEQAREFLAPTDGYGTLIAEQQGITLGSVHISRNRRTGGMGIEHTRPVYNYLR